MSFVDVIDVRIIHQKVALWFGECQTSGKMSLVYQQLDLGSDIKMDRRNGLCVASRIGNTPITLDTVQLLLGVLSSGHDLMEIPGISSMEMSLAHARLFDQQVHCTQNSIIEPSTPFKTS